MKTIVEQYTAVTKSHNLSVGQVSINPAQTISSHSQLLETIEAFQAKQAWLCCQSEILFSTQQQMLPVNEESGYVLYGELVKGNISLQIQQVNSSWLVTEIEEQTGVDCLIKKTSYLATDAVNNLDYAVYWINTDAKGYRQAAYRFLGFRETGLAS